MESNEKVEYNYVIQINDLEEIIQKIIEEHKKLSSFIEKEIIKSFKNLDETIKILIKDNRSKEIIMNEFKEIVSPFVDIYENETIQNINKLIQDLKNLINKIEFEPQNISNFSYKSGLSYPNYSSIFYGDFNNSNYGINKENQSLLVCDFCKKNKGIYFCEKCNNYKCEECYNKKKDILQKKHIYMLMNEKKMENEKEKKEFLKSFIRFFKKYILKCSYIIQNENQDYSNSNIFTKIQYPSIKNEDNLENQKNFLNEIDTYYNLIKKETEENILLNETKISNLIFIKKNHRIWPLILDNSHFYIIFYIFLNV
jgi:hypothetical protein